MFIHLHNWRCFSSTQFEFPLVSMVIIDQNGSGKTSLISAVYTLFTGLNWPSTKLAHHLQSNTAYFGISTKDVTWSFTGKINPSGRISTKISMPENFSTAFSVAELNTFANNTNSIEIPRIFTYIPTDNYIFSSSRSQKLQFFDDLITQQKGVEYEKLVIDLSKLIRSKQQLIKHIYETNNGVDMVLVHTLNEKILTISNQIWDRRREFFLFLNNRLPTFSQWISSPLGNWKLNWETTNKTGSKTKLRNFTLDYVSLDELDNLFKREVAAGKVLFGAQRDDISISSDHISIENSLSRGEMRLLILFIKDTARVQLNKPAWFFLDDVFNEFDTKREEIVFREVLSHFALFIATGTRKPEFKCTTCLLEDIKLK